MSNLASRVIAELAAGIDLDKVLKSHALSFEKARQILATPEARRQLAARRKLAAIHTHLVAHRFSSYAVHRLCQLLSDEKADLRLKGAVAVLNIVGLDRFKKILATQIKKSARVIPGRLQATPEDAQILRDLASIVAARKARASAARNGACRFFRKG